MRILLQTLSMFNLIIVSATSVIACNNKQQSAQPYPVNQKTLPTKFQIVPPADRGEQFTGATTSQKLTNYYQNKHLNLNWLTKPNIVDRRDERYQTQLRNKLNEILGQKINYSNPTTIKWLNNFINYTNQELTYRASNSEINAYETEINKLLQDMVTWDWTGNGETFSPAALDQSLNPRDRNDTWNQTNKFSKLFTLPTTSRPTLNEETMDALSYAWARSKNIPIRQLLGSVEPSELAPDNPALAYVGVRGSLPTRNTINGLRSRLGVAPNWNNPAVINANYQVGHASTNRKSSVFTHEFGHILDFYAGIKNSAFKQNYNLHPTNPIPFQGFTNVVSPVSPTLMHQWVPQTVGLPKNDLLAAVLMDWALIPSDYGRNPIIPESFAETYAYWLLSPLQSVTWANGRAIPHFNTARLGVAWAFWNNFFLNNFKQVFPV